MGFTTTIKKKVEKTEKYPEIPVLTQKAVAGGLKENTVFELNVEAMKQFGFALNLANASKITVGYNDNQDIALAAVDLENIYTSNVTAKNTFSNKKLLERLVKNFDIDPSVDNEFLLLYDEVNDGTPAMACPVLILEDSVTTIGRVDNGVVAPIENLEEVVSPIEEEEVACLNTETPEHSMDDIPQAPTSEFNSMEATFEADETTKLPLITQHVIKIGSVPVGDIVESEKKDDWEN